MPSPAGADGGWNFADAWEAIAARFPDAPALVHGSQRLTWAAFERRAGGVATWLVEQAGLTHQGKVAQYLPNRPEYLESVFASFKAGFVPVNTNYRYTGEELRYLWRDADVAAVVFDGAFVEECERLRGELAGIRAWLWADPEDGSTCPSWATPYEEAAATPSRPAPWPRSGDDLYLLYTGGTTGMPKGVMWRQDDLFCMLEESSGRRVPDEVTPAAFAAALAKPGPKVLAGAPLMHGTAAFFSMNAFNLGGSVVTLTGRRFDVAELLDVVVGERVSGICIVGDAFARPILQRLAAEPDRWDLSSLRVVFSSGVMLSAESKQALLRHAPRAIVVDSLGTSESGAVGRSVTTADADAATAAFSVGRNTRVVDEDGRDVEPGSGRTGRLAVGGRIPLGYYKDPEKTKATFVEIGGKRYVVAGDWAQVAADGTVTLLGRSSACINTGGEKVHAEEVEEVLKRHPGVADAAVVGVPDDRFGEVVVALVQCEAGATVPVEEMLAAARTSLSGYKIPRAVHFVDTIGRSPSGKVDLEALRRLARERTQPRLDAPAGR